MIVDWIQFQELGDHRGSLVAIEIGKQKEIPFNVSRIYYLFKTGSDVSRGFHAHKELRQVMFALSGSCEVILDDGRQKKRVSLDSPTKGILVNQLIWREMHNFSADCVVLVLASDHYDESDYIRSYDEFLEIVRS